MYESKKKYFYGTGRRKTYLAQHVGGDQGLTNDQLQGLHRHAGQG